MIHLVDQYVGSTALGRYTLGTSFSMKETIFPGTTGVPTLGENDLLAIVHTAAKTGGSGHGHVYHVFLPSGVDTCFDEGFCYSPDNPPTWVFCAYHFTATFTDIGAVYYTVDPFQNVSGCSLPLGTPNGQLADSTNSTLSHELFESITDPDISTGYRAPLSPAGFPEIGDICALGFGTVPLNGKNYALQLEYSNKYQACASVP
jgi:hypothetical protein